MGKKRNKYVKVEFQELKPYIEELIDIKCSEREGEIEEKIDYLVKHTDNVKKISKIKIVIIIIGLILFYMGVLGANQVIDIMTQLLLLG